jgi:hypothetical protein
VTCSSEASADFQQTIQCYFPDDKTLHYCHCKNVKSYRYGEHLFLTLQLLQLSSFRINCHCILIEGKITNAQHMVM